MNKMFASIMFVLKYIKYEIVYYILGVWGVYEDILYKKRNKCDPINNCGKVAVITGGARGLGAVMVKKLLQCDMHVIIGCRNVDAGKETVRTIKESGVTTGIVNILPVDMASLESVKTFSEEVIKLSDRLHLLVNNAGIMFPPYNETVDGYESQWGVNYMGHFYLTHLLMDRLVSTGRTVDTNTRIVNVTSCAHFAGFPIDFNNINMKNEYIPSAAYAQSKLAQLMFTKTLDHQLKSEGVNVRAMAVHPGVVDTDIFDGTIVKKIFPWAIKLFFKTPDQGATSILYASISPKLNGKGGIYISNCRNSPVSKVAEDPVQQEKLFNYSLSSLNIKKFGVTN